MIVIVDVNEHLSKDGQMYVRNIDSAIEELFHNDVEGVILTASVCTEEVARLTAIVKTIDSDIIVVLAKDSLENAFKEVQDQLRIQRLSQVTFSDTLSTDNLADQIQVV